YGNPLPEDNPVSSDEDSDNKEIPLELFITDEKSSETDEESNESEINN
ncbi:17235_t:CDS:2, partial [Rhizophagus irregularis]